MRQQDDVSGCEAYHKNRKHGDCHEDGARFPRAVFYVGGAQGLDDAHVAYGAEDERDEEEKRRNDGEKVQVLLAQVMVVEDVVTGGYAQVRDCHGLIRDQQRGHAAYR